jgi:hypothetical protein
MSNAFLTQFAGTLGVIAALAVSALLWAITAFIYRIVTEGLTKVLSQSQADLMASIMGDKNTKQI